MAGLEASARAARAFAASQTIMGGNDSEPEARPAYVDDPAPAPVTPVSIEAPLSESEDVVQAPGSYRDDATSEEKPQAVRVAQNAGLRPQASSGNAAPSAPTANKTEAERELDKRPQIKGFVEKASRDKRINPLWATLMGYQESSWDPSKTTKSGTYKGIFQLSDKEFQKRRPGGNIYDAEQNITEGIGSLVDRYFDFLRKYKREPSITELYLSHLQGEGGFAAHLQNPNQLAWKSMRNTYEGRLIAQKNGSAAADAWAQDAVWNNIPGDLKRKYPGLSVNSLTSSRYIDLWKEKFSDDGRYGSFLRELEGITKDEDGKAVDSYSRRWWPKQADEPPNTMGLIGDPTTRTWSTVKDAASTYFKMRSQK